jgi:hypothetical protein
MNHARRARGRRRRGSAPAGRRRKVAAQAIGSDGIAAVGAGVDTIEHGDGLTDTLMDEMIRRVVYWVPTLAVDRNQWPLRSHKTILRNELVAFPQRSRKCRPVRESTSLAVNLPTLKM